MADATFTAGLLHDIGKLIVAANLPHEYNLVVNQAQQECITQQASEQKNWGTTHAELGACLLCMWGLPISIIEALRFFG